MGLHERPDPAPPFRYLAWVLGEPGLFMDEFALVAAAAKTGSEVFVAWEVDYDAQQVVHVLVQHVEDKWVFITDDGNTRRTVHPHPNASRDDLFGWTVDFMAGLRPLRALAVAPEAWRARRESTDDNAYTPYGFSTPARWADDQPDDVDAAGTWVFDWCPELVAEQIAGLHPEERPAYLTAMYARLCSWVELIDLDPEERERQLDNRLYDTDEAAYRVVCRVQMDELERRRG